MIFTHTSNTSSNSTDDARRPRSPSIEEDYEHNLAISNTSISIQSYEKGMSVTHRGASLE